MTRFNVVVALAAAALFAAAPAHAQQSSVPARSALAAPAVTPLPQALAPAMAPAAAQGSRAERHLTVRGHTAIGAWMGALTGIALTMLKPSCWAENANCGTMLLVQGIGGGALVGGALGAGVGVLANRFD